MRLDQFPSLQQPHEAQCCLLFTVYYFVLWSIYVILNIGNNNDNDDDDGYRADEDY